MVRERSEMRTRRLLLRPFRSDDAEDLFAVYRDEEFAFYVLEAPSTRDGIERGLAAIVATPWQDHPWFAVVHDGRVVGMVNLFLDYANQIGNLSYGIARPLWRQGLTTEAAGLVVDYGFEAFGLAKVSARVDPRNVGAIRVLERLGMQREGLLRSAVLRRGERSGRLYFGLLRDEWEASRAQPAS